MPDLYMSIPWGRQALCIKDSHISMQLNIVVIYLEISCHCVLQHSPAYLCKFGHIKMFSFQEVPFLGDFRIFGLLHLSIHM